MLKNFLLILFMCFVLSGCAVNPVTGRQELMLVSEAREIEMGSELYPNALWGAEGGGGESSRDTELARHLSGVIRDIHSVSHRPHLPVSFAIQNSTVPNAWAIPGYVVITRGLLAGLANEAEFAFVMGHEMGHVSARHSASQVSYGILQQIGLAGAGLALKGESYSDAAVGLGAVGSTLVLLKYGRDDELEADRLGILYMTRLGYDPEYGISAHENLERAADEYMASLGREPGGERGVFEDLLSTHPRTSVRIEEIRQMIGGVPPYTVKGGGAGNPEFLRLTAGLRETNAIYKSYYDPAVRALKKGDVEEAGRLSSLAIKADPAEAPFHALRGFIMIERKEYKKAVGSFEDALARDDGYQPAYRGMGVVSYLAGEYAPALEYMGKALALFPGDASSHYFTGMSYYRIGRCGDALPHLTGFARARPRHPEVHGVIGICHEKTNRPREAYDEYIMQLKVAPDNEMGRHAAARVRALRPYMERQRRR